MSKQPSEHVWETLYQAGNTPWEYGYAAPPLAEWLEKRGPLRGRILVPGCGFGRDAWVLATAGKAESEVVGVDIAPSAIVNARKFSSAPNASYELADFFVWSKHFLSSFDWVFEHTCFCAIHPGLRQNYVDSVASVLKPDGRLLAIFFLNPWDPGEETPEGGGPPYGVSKEELDRLFGDRFELAEEWIPERSYPGRRQRELIRLLKRKA